MSSAACRAAMSLHGTAATVSATTAGTPPVRMIGADTRPPGLSVSTEAASWLYMA
jgi:hypothetical protein